MHKPPPLRGVNTSVHHIAEAEHPTHTSQLEDTIRAS